MGSASTGWFNAGSNPTVETKCDVTLSRNINTITVSWMTYMQLPSDDSYLGTGSLEIYCSCNGVSDGPKTIKEHDERWSGTGLNYVGGSFTFQDSSPTTKNFSINFWSDSDAFSSSGIFDVSIDCSVEGLPIATINSFTGNDITGNFKVNYTSYSDSFNYKLRLSIPSVVAITTISNYTNNSNVAFTNSNLQTLQQYMPESLETPIGAVIETWNGNTKVGESTELVNTCTWYPIDIKVNEEWKKAIPYIKVNGSWKKAIPFKKISGNWKRGI